MKKFLTFVLALVCVGAVLGGCGGREALKEPPPLRVSSGDSGIEAMLGSYSWRCKDTAVEADALHPLQAEEHLAPWSAETTTASLSFAIPPDEVSVRCWSDQCWGDLSAESEEIPVDGLSFPLKEGGYIYEVTAKWISADAYGGTARYAFYLTVPAS